MSYFLDHPEKIVISALLAMIPAVIWAYVFLQKTPEKENRKMVLMTFVAGMFSVTPILAYKYLWQYFPSLNAFVYTNAVAGNFFTFTNILQIPVSIVLTFMLVGVIEEFMKHFVVRMTDDKKLRTVDDAIIFSIIAALGFAFVENTLYFFYIWLFQNTQNLIISIFFRSVFSTFAHILFSGMYGYFYGIAHFATPIFQEETRKKRFWTTRALHAVLRIKTQTIFKDEKIMEGLIVASLLHAVFNVLLEMQWTFLIVPYLMMGYALLSYLIAKKEHHRVYGRLQEAESGT